MKYIVLFIGILCLADLFFYFIAIISDYLDERKE